MHLRTLVFPILLAFVACAAPEEAPVEQANDPARIVSLHGTATEVLFALGFGDQIVLRDVTSTYPPEVMQVPDAGHISGISAESILSVKPQLLFVAKTQLKPSVRQQLQASGIEIVELVEPESVEKGVALLADIAKAMDVNAAEQARLESAYSCISAPPSETVRALFVYGRGNGNFLIGGSGTPVHAFMEAAGALNVASEVDGFKPLSTEALLTYDPEVILMFDHSFEAAGAVEGLLQVPGMQGVQAGKTQRIYHYPGQQINGFGPRTCEALADFHQRLYP